MVFASIREHASTVVLLRAQTVIRFVLRVVNILEINNNL